MFRQILVALRALLILTVVLGIGYPLAVTAIGQTAFADKANGQLLVDGNGDTVGSAIIGQSFTDADGVALPEWFQSRPSAAAYNAGASSGSNYGPDNADLLAAVAERRADLGADAPADALYASASGLDPHISPEYARLQVARVAAARGIDERVVAALVESFVQGRDLGYLGEPTVNVLRLNIALAKLG